MNIIVKTKNLEDHSINYLESFINKKIGSLKKFISGFENHALPMAGGRSLFDAFVEVERETKHHQKGKVYKAEVKIYMPGKTLFAKVSGEDLMKIIGEVRDELEAEIRKYKTKIIEFPRRKQRQSQNRT